jgi:hypothetical protein
MLTQKYVNELFRYEDGVLYWAKPRQCVKVGNAAGSLEGRGYLQTRIDLKKYLNHRIIYLMHHGYMPEYIDHIDGDPTNNHIENLRPTSLLGNAHNRRISKNNTSGVKGVTWNKASGRWQAQIRVGGGKRKYLGLFDTLDDAAKALRAERVKHHKEFANHG